MIYAISDLHAHSKTFKEYKKILKPEDKVFYLGDAVDKGDGTLNVFFAIIRDKRFEFIMGNHEYMLYKWLLFSSKLSEIEDMDEAEYEEYSENYPEYEWLRLERKSGRAHLVYENNDGARTIDDYLKRSKEDFDEMFDTLSTLPLEMEADINKRGFLFVHACPLKTSKMKDGIVSINNYNLFKEREGYSEPETIVWERDYFIKYKDRIVITGHNPVPYCFGKDKKEGTEYFPKTDGEYENIPDENGWYHPIKIGTWYDIDGGLAFRARNYGNLFILRLDDMAVKIIENKDDDRIEEALESFWY